MALSIDEILGIDPHSSTQQLARELLDNEHELFRALVRQREASRLSIEEVAGRMGIPAEDVRGIESGHRDLHLSTLRRYAHAIRSRVDYQVTPMQTTFFHNEGAPSWGLVTTSPSEWAADAPTTAPSPKRSRHGV